MSQQKAVSLLEELTPEMRKLVAETNIKIQQAGPIASAWDAALRRAFSKRESASTGSKTGNQSTPQAARSKNFWEREPTDSSDDIVKVVDLPNGVSPSSSRPSTPGKLNRARTPSTPRLGRTSSLGDEAESGVPRSPSPSKTHSPVRRGSSGAGPGEI